MKKVCLLLVLPVIISVLLCGCGISAEKMYKNLEESGYKINEYNSDLIEDMQNDLKYQYGGSGKILSSFTASENDDYIVVIEFEKKSDLDIMYKVLKKDMMQNEKIDLNGNILFYGSKNAVKAALK